MSVWWSFTVLCQPDRLDPADVEAVVRDLADRGYGPASGVDGLVHGMSADGMGSLQFGSLSAAAAWLARDEGLLSLHHEELDFQLDVSVQRHDAAVAAEFEAVPASTNFDEFELGVSERALGATIWKEVREAWLRAVAALPAEFACGYDEATVEALIAGWCVHARVAQGRLPPVLPWISCAPLGGALAAQLERAAEVVGGALDQVGGLVVLQLGDVPSSSALSVVREASARWQAATADRGCP